MSKLLSISLFLILILILFATLPLSARKMTITAYSLHSRTATGTRPRRGCCAASRHLLGRRIYVQNVGWLICTDICPKKNVIDVWKGTKKECKKFGRRKVKVKIRSVVKRRKR